MITMKFLNLSQAISALNKIPAKAIPAVKQELAVGALEIQGTAIRSVQQRSPGSRPGVRYKPKRNVFVSAPGKPPNTDTGRLVQSIQVGFTEGGLRALVGTNVKYGAWLEFGTKDTAARPWLAPAYRTHRDAINKMIVKAINEAMKK